MPRARRSITDTYAERRQTLYDGLLSERGGAECFTTVELSIARAVSKLLATDDIDPKNAAVASELLARLPQKRAEKADLSRLDDRQLHQLDKLVAIATGTAPPKKTLRAEILDKMRADPTHLNVQFVTGVICTHCRKMLNKRQAAAAKATAKAAQAAPVVDSHP